MCRTYFSVLSEYIMKTYTYKHLAQHVYSALESNYKYKFFYMNIHFFINIFGEKRTTKMVINLYSQDKAFRASKKKSKLNSGILPFFSTWKTFMEGKFWKRYKFPELWNYVSWYELQHFLFPKSNPAAGLLIH